jgi:ABC-type multidrug transport system fused ATPase/permease subunit
MAEIDGEGGKEVQHGSRKATEKIAFPTALFATLCSVFSLIFQYYSTQMSIQAQMASVEYQEAIQNKMKFLEAAEELEVQNYRTLSIYQNMVDELLDAESCSKSCKIEVSKKLTNMLVFTMMKDEEFGRHQLKFGILSFFLKEIRKYLKVYLMKEVVNYLV